MFLIKFFSILFLFVTFLLGDTQLKKVTVQLSWKNQFQFAGYYMAKELGYYKDIGLDVDLKEFEYGMNLSKMMENNSVDFAIGRSSLLIDKANGQDIVALAAIFQDSPLVLLTTDTSIQELDDLKNKKIMITVDAKETVAIKAMLNANKIALNDLQLLKHSFNLDDLISGKTDIMASYISNETIALDEKNIPYKTFDPKDYGFDFYSDILYTSSKYIEKNPTVTKEFLEATLKGWKYAFNNIGQTSKIIYQKYNTQNKPLLTLLTEGEILKELSFHQNCNKIGCLDGQKLQKIVDIYKVLGLVNKDIDLDSFVYKHNPYRVINISLSPNELISFALIVFLLFISIMSILYYLSIKKRWLITKKSLDKKLKELERKDIQLYEQSKMAAMGEMIANISHQWRQPLSVISTGVTGMQLQKEYGLLKDDEFYNVCEVVNENAQYLSRTIEDFRNFIIGDRTKKVFLLKDNIASFLQLVNGRFKSNHINIVLDIDNEIKIDGYENELIQCLMSISNNSRDALLENNVTDGVLFISTYSKDNQAVIVIKDNAGGIPNEILPKIFEPYFTTKHQSQGTGLGLHLTYDFIVKGMGGAIDVNNASFEYKNVEYTGAEFKLSLPLV